MGNIQEEEQEENAPAQDELKNKNKKQPPSEPVKDIRVIKWYDYSTKYGLGYALSNGAIGVFFNDGTKLIAPPGEYTVILLLCLTSLEHLFLLRDLWINKI